KRFYKTASVIETDGGFAVLLDGKPVNTPAKHRLLLPARELAEIVAQEWNEQETEIDPGTMAMTRLANLALDRVAEKASETADEIKRYAASDLVFYRAEEPEGLVARQEQHWAPVLRWAKEALGANFMLAAGVKHVAQPDAALEAIGEEIGRFAPPFALAALASVTQLTGSALIALMLANGRLTPVEAWNSAHVDEDWNARQWGEDAEAAAGRARRFAEFEAAAKMLALTDARGPQP
ncbi:MAG TPA: ATP12 family protein, partial [Xanthobacteraceae bacterium]|nr:ATP12 family protein [Xanthobacteraceae bacterium]